MVSHVNKTHISSVNLPNVQTAILQQVSRGGQHYIEGLTRGEESLCSETLDNVQKKEGDIMSACLCCKFKAIMGRGA